MTKIKTTHVGSLPRSDELSDLLFKKDKKEKIDLDNFDAVVKKDVKKIVKKQINLGIDFISDGEMSKISYATYVKDRIDGFSGESERKAPQDLDDFPTFKERIARTGGTPTYTRPCCTHELKIKDKLSLTKDINNFKSIQKVKWIDKKPIAFFRGSSTGCGTTINTNPRFLLSDISYKWKTITDKQNFIDVALSKLVSRIKVYNQFIGLDTTKEYKYLVGSFISLEEQLKYKYIFNIMSFLCTLYKFALYLDNVQVLFFKHNKS